MQMKNLMIQNIPSEVLEKGNGLAKLAGTWTDEEHARFERSVAANEQVDEELWR